MVLWAHDVSLQKTKLLFKIVVCRDCPKIVNIKCTMTKCQMDDVACGTEIQISAIK